MAIFFYSVLLEMDTGILEYSSVKNLNVLNWSIRIKENVKRWNLQGIFKMSSQNYIITRQTSYTELDFEVTSKNM